MDKINLALVRQSFAQTVFTQKVHEVAAERTEDKSGCIKKLNIVMIFLVLVCFGLQAYFSSNIIISYVGAFLTIIEIVLLIASLSFNFEQKSLSHKMSALQYLGLRDKYRGFIVDLLNSALSPADIITKRESLHCEYKTISDTALPTTRSDYQEAQIRLNKKGIVESEDFTWSNEEIDRFLPENLRGK